MAINQADYHALKSLPCFNIIVAIELLTDGMSQTSIKVTTDENTFLAKKLNATTANTEVSVALSCAKQGLSPQVIYHNEQWLITEFIIGTSLERLLLKRSEKISTAVMLMAKLHQLVTPQHNRAIPVLNLSKIVKPLLARATSFSAKNKLTLLKLTRLLSDEVNAQITLFEPAKVVCHGDVNFTNILIGSNSCSPFDNDNIATSAKPWLIDFECAQLAPVEYDIAMFIAINNIAFININEVITSYSLIAPAFQLNKKLLTYYILYSYFINGLWYLASNTNSTTNNPMFLLATEQWSSFDNIVSKQALALPTLASLLN